MTTLYVLCVLSILFAAAVAWDVLIADEVTAIEFEKWESRVLTSTDVGYHARHRAVTQTA